MQNKNLISRKKWIHHNKNVDISAWTGIEILFKLDDINIDSVYLEEYQINDCIKLLKNLGKNITVFLDYHGVTDLFDENDEIVDSNIAVICYVGYNSKHRTITRKDLINRINNGTINFAVFVFKRTERADAIATKAWVIENCISNNTYKIFLDDSDDHIISTNNKNIKNLVTYHITNEDKYKISNILLLFKDY